MEPEAAIPKRRFAMDVFARTLCLLLLIATPAFSRAESITFDTADSADKPHRVDMKVNTTGKLFTSAGGGKTSSLDLTAHAEFGFLERRLPPGGRDAQSLRAARAFDKAFMESTVGPRVTRTELPKAGRLVISGGESSGIVSYSRDIRLTRDAMDLIEMPGDPLALSALLPTTAIDDGGTWSPPEWAAQMLGAIEAIEKATMSCKVTALTAETATISIEDQVKGQRQGANLEVKITGTLTYDRANQLIAAASLNYEIKSAIGAVTPGLDAQVQVELTQSITPNAGSLSDSIVKDIPIATPADAMDLTFEAAPWGLKLIHHRDWYLFHALMEGSPQVAILRLVDRGSLLAQCNLSPIAAVAPGKSTPAEQFESDIKASLGDRLKTMSTPEQLEGAGGTKIIRLVADGDYAVKGPKGDVNIPTRWIYYLCTAPSGKQASFVFAVEGALVEELGTRDEELVKNLQFVDRFTPPAQTSQAQPKP
jgi:hypothetical protein